ncbi:MAG: DNA methyltransferase [Lentisphaerae bacterium RIFOXYA12_FULL_48_11]|nr:MAG: DNA methyltransferase [Lentisphaerae bacterium RIFOXYA12_FULL_48_11]
MDIKQLETWLWESACSLRGSLDAPKFKDYILPLIFIRRLSDVFDDEIERLSKEFGDKQSALKLVKKDHSLVRFYIPEDARWESIRALTTKIGQLLTEKMRLISKENPRLQGVIDIVDFNATVSGERIVPDEKLSRLIEILGRKEYRLGLQDVEPDIFGRAYEYLLRKFAEGQGQSAGEFLTPREVGLIKAKILDPKPGQTAYDPTAGSAGLLIKLELVLKEKEKNLKRPIQLYGQEQNHVTYAMAQMNMIIHDMQGEMAIGDTLRNPKFLEGSALKKFDLVTANPMWNQDGYITDFYEQDTYNRFPAGYPSASSADWGWVQHMFSSLNDKGKASIVLDTGAVSRGSGNQGGNKERDIRKWFVDNDYIEGIILLPENLFYNTPAPGIILILNKAKPKDRKNKIVLLNASLKFKKGRPKNFIPDGFDDDGNYSKENDVITEIADAFKTGKDVEKLVKVISKEEAIKSDYNISPSRYIEVGEAEVYRDIAEVLGEIEEFEAIASELNKELKGIFKELGIKSKKRL